VVWSSSSNVFAAVPVALDSAQRAVRALVIYYGYGRMSDPRIDIPVFVARAGLDAGTNRLLDSLSTSLVSAGSPVTVMNYPAGHHGFDILDRTAMSAHVIEATLDFMQRAAAPALQRDIAGGVVETRAAVALAHGRHADAVRVYAQLRAERPRDAQVALQLGRAQLANGQPADALASFTSARELGVGGARDVGLPGARAAMRSGQRDVAAQWVLWAIRNGPPSIRNEVRAETELAPLLDHPALRQP
jgi:hypothetical protein